MKRFIILPLSLMCVAADGLLAEQIQLATGEILIGQVIEQSDAAVIVQHPLLGRLEIDPAAVIQISPDAPAAQAPPHTPDAPERTPATASAAEVSQTQPQPSAATAVDTSAAAGDTLPAADVPPDLPDWMLGWESKAEFAVNGQMGRKDAFNGRFAFVTHRKTDKHRTRFEATYYSATAQGQRIDNEFATELLHDWLLPDSKWFYFAQGRYNYDQFADWDQRVAGAGGVGYSWFDSPTFHLDTRVGAGLAREFGSDNHRIQPEGYLGLDLTWEIVHGDQSVALNARLFPNLDQVGEFRSLTSAEWRVKMAQVQGLSFKVGIEHEYDSQTENVEPHSLKYLAGLVYEF